MPIEWECTDIAAVKTNGGAIVNAANGRLNLGGGIAGALEKASGGKLQAECDKVSSYSKNKNMASNQVTSFLRREKISVVPDGGAAVTLAAGISDARCEFSL